jgi:hypothetical protein
VSEPTTQLVTVETGAAVRERIRATLETMVGRKIGAWVSAEINLDTGHATVNVVYKKEEA